MYLSRYVINNQAKNLPPAEQNFINQMMDKWVARSPDSAAGISIMSSAANLTNPSFTPLATNFPNYSTNGTLEGRTIDVVDFAGFCNMVCLSLWKGI